MFRKCSSTKLARKYPPISHIDINLQYLLFITNKTDSFNHQTHNRLDRMETTNLVLTSCYSVAQKKLSDTNKVVKVCSKKLNDSKRDLDLIYKKLALLKSKIKEEYPALYEKHSHFLIKDNSLADEDDT